MKEDCIHNKAAPLIRPGNNGRHTITEKSGDTLAINRFQPGVGFQIHTGKQRSNNKNACTLTAQS